MAQNKKLDILENTLSRHTKNDNIKVDILNNIGFEYWMINPEKSIINGKKALNLSMKIDYKKGFAKANRIIGVAHWAQGNHKEALQYLLISQEKYKKNKDYKGVADTTLNIGLIYSDLKEYEEALKKYNEAIDLYTYLKRTDRIATAYTKIATIWIEREKYLEAFDYLINALAIHTKNNFTYGIAEVHNRLSIYYLKKNKLNQATYHIYKSITIGEEIKDTYGIASGRIVLGKILRIKGDLNAAERNLKMGLHNARENNLKKQELYAYEELKKLKIKMNQPEQALSFYNKYIKLKDTLFNFKKSKEIASLEFKNILKQTNSKISFLKQEQGRKKIINYSLTTGILLISIGAYIILYISRKRSKKEIEFAIKEQNILKSKNSLAQEFIQNEKLELKKLKEQLEFKNKQLTSYTFNFQQKNEVINQIRNIIKHLDKESLLEEKILIKELKKLAEENLNIDKNWENFRNYFEETKIGFHAKLKLKHKNLNANDLRICSLLRLNLNTKETANVLGISTGSLKTARYRLRKKLNLNPKQEIIDYLISLEKEISAEREILN